MVKMPHWPIPYGRKEIDLSLSRIRLLLARLGDPHLNLPPVIHIAGTNGKGSTLAYLKAILRAAGYLVHSYISPHLVRFNERICLAGQEISDEDLYYYSEKCRLASCDEQLTFFEGTTAVAFLAFASIKADVVLLEVGMGGRLDATNVIDNPALTIITSISHDHTEYLGDTLTQIAGEKAGIIKKNQPCIISWQQQEVLNVLLQHCHNKNASSFCYGVDWHVACNDGETFDLIINDSKFITMLGDEWLKSTQSRINSQDDQGNHGLPINYTLGLPNPSLPGIHQFVNASTSVFAALYIARANIFPKIIPDHLAYGISHTSWPGRLQRLDCGVLYQMLPLETELWLDGAHNVGGAEMLAASISNMEPKKHLYLIHGRTKNRDIVAYLRYFQEITEIICCVTVQNEPLAERAEVIHEVALKMGFDSRVCTSLHEAVLECLHHHRGRAYADRSDQLSEIGIRILICGSLYLAGDVLKANQEN